MGVRGAQAVEKGTKEQRGDEVLGQSSCIFFFFSFPSLFVCFVLFGAAADAPCEEKVLKDIANWVYTEQEEEGYLPSFLLSAVCFSLFPSHGSGHRAL